jgi:hypothetical protein
MLEISMRRLARAGAVFLALFFALGCVAPLAAEALENSFHTDSCDRAKGGCCCHRNARGTTRGTAISDAGCPCDSSGAPGFSGDGQVVFSSRTVWSAGGPAAIEPAAERESCSSSASSLSLRQRPPPSLRFS